MLTPDSAGVAWRKSSFSGGNSGGDGCLEVAILAGGEVAVRDTKDRTLLPHLHSAQAWREFLAAVHAREFEA